MFDALSTIQITMLIVWIAIVAIGIIVESQTSDLVSIWFSISGAVAMVCALANFDVYIQIAVFAILTFILILATRPIVKKMTNNADIKTNADRLVGMVGKVIKTIEEEGKGIVKVDFQEWTAVAAKNNSIEEGAHVVIKEIVGNKLIVDIIEEIEIK